MNFNVVTDIKKYYTMYSFMIKNELCNVAFNNNKICLISTELTAAELDDIENITVSGVMVPSDTISGKKKRGAAVVRPGDALLSITTNARTITLYSPIKASIVEIADPIIALSRGERPNAALLRQTLESVCFVVLFPQLQIGRVIGAVFGELSGKGSGVVRDLIPSPDKVANLFMLDAEMVSERARLEG